MDDTCVDLLCSLLWLTSHQGAISNTQRIDAALPTIQHALDNGAKVRATLCYGSYARVLGARLL